MGKSGKLFASLVNGVKGLKSPSTREKSTKENSHTRKERDSSVTKQRCMWSLGKSSSRNKSSADVSLHPCFEVKDVQVEQLSQGSRPPASSFHYTDALLEEITSSLADDIVREQPPSHDSYQEHWATILKLSDDESDPEESLTHDTQPEEQAAVRIQAAIRRYLVQQKFKRTVKAVIRLQAVARGRMVRRQAATTLRCIHALVKFQANARGWLVRTSEVGQRVQQHLEEIMLQDPTLLSKQQNGSQPIAFALDKQLCSYSSKQSYPAMDFEPDKEYWGWAWLDRWMAARPWENSSSTATKEKPRITPTDDETESNNVVEEGADIIVSNLDKKNEATRGIQTDGFISSANISALREVPLPPAPPPAPPPPPLPSFIKTAHPLMKHPVVCVTVESSENASLHAPPMTPVAKEEFNESASLCTSPTTPVATKLGTPNITTENNKGNSVFSTSVASEVSLPTLAHTKEPEEIAPLGTPVYLDALQAEITNPSAGESSPPASSFLQQSESSSSSSFTMKDEDLRQNSTLVPWHIADSEGEDEINSAEPAVKEISVLNDEPVSLTDQETTAMGTASDVSKHDDTFEKSASGTRNNSISGNAEAGNITAEVEENVKNAKGDSVEGCNDTREGCVQLKRSDLDDASANPILLPEASVKRMGSILVKYEQGEGVSQSLPSYMATTKSSKAKTRSQASPKPMPESPRPRLASPKHSLGSKRTPTSEGKGSFANARQIVHVRAGSKGQSASLIKDGSSDSAIRSLGDSGRHAK